VDNKFTRTDNKINVFHICEHPGAFIYAVGDYIKKNRLGIEYNFKFQSLKPKHDSKIFKTEYKLLNKYRDNLDYGVTGTGDITDITNIEYYINRYKNDNITLITADCGLDCSEDFLNQETNLIKLFYSATITAIGILDSKGIYICKLFTWYKQKTIELISLCNYLFKEVILNRAITNKSGSDEIYMICKYPIKERIDMRLLFEYHKNYNNNYIIERYDDNLYKQLEIASKMMEVRKLIGYNQFIFAINNRDYINKNSKIKTRVKLLVNYYIEYYINYLGIVN
jgi:23S rRNA U2552 (ribose-2'-O)-methylase RlmE/FtsJ